jgi:hypothetical protein
MLINKIRNQIADLIATISTWSMAKDINGDTICPPLKSIHYKFLRKLTKLAMWITPAEDLEKDMQRSVAIAERKRSAKYLASQQKDTSTKISAKNS